MLIREILEDMDFWVISVYMEMILLIPSLCLELYRYPASCITSQLLTIIVIFYNLSFMLPTLWLPLIFLALLFWYPGSSCVLQPHQDLESMAPQLFPVLYHLMSFFLSKLRYFLIIIITLLHIPVTSHVIGTTSMLLKLTLCLLHTCTCAAECGWRKAYKPFDWSHFKAVTTDL